ncbi:MAG: response regulator [Actinobacteria bacterium]|nr:response regulator [Actinomycetota bacterium]
MSPPGSPRVLFADDDPILHRLLQVNFRAVGITIDSVGRGDDALERVITAPPDALVLDATMPGMDGHEVYQRLREEPGLASLPVVFLTGRGAEEFEAYAGEHVSVVTKPFDPTELVKIVCEAIGVSG